MTFFFLFKDNETPQSDRQVRACTHMHTCTHLCLRFYSTEDRENKTLPPSTNTHTRPAGRGLLLSSSRKQSLSISQTLLFQSKLLYRHTMWFQPFHGKSGKRGKYKFLILSHKMYMCTHDFNAHWQTPVVPPCARTHSLRQVITLNVLRSTDKKGKKPWV